MNRPQWITAGIALLVVIGLYATTSKKVFGPPKVKQPSLVSASPSSILSIDTILYHARERLTAEQITRLGLLEKSITRGDVKDQKIHIFHQLARFWADTARRFEPYAWYTAEAARLENSEKSLTFAAHLFLNYLVEEPDQQLKQWEASQAKDLFERSLKVNPANDSSKTGLGASIVYGGLGSPMEGIAMIREVISRDSANIFAQMTLGQASILSGQLEKASERFKTVVQIQPTNLEAIIRVAEIAEQTGNKTEAITWYQKSLPLLDNAAIKKEVEARIAELRK
jgi:tetratricopeptide (TPR) repeat protein